jgi:hypothetical protein
MVGIVFFASALALGIIFTMGWLVLIGFAVLPAVSIWGMVSSGPGSKYNPYHH